MPLMPCFKTDQAGKEGKIIGIILAGYGELEVVLLACLVAIEHYIDIPIKRLFKRMPAERRIKLAREALLPGYIHAGLHTEMNEALNDLDWCRELRNQYAHCQWGWTSTEGLFFVNLEQLADKIGPISKVMDQPRYIDVPLLQEQEAYCNYVRESLMHLETAYAEWDRAKRQITRTTFVFPKPSSRQRPLLHN
jgi:hypothetical protein